jgi:hypothetical protein
MISIDKQAHFYSGFAIAALLYPYIFLWGLVVASVIGYLKEYAWDRRFGGTVDRNDFLSTVAGACAACIAHYIILAAL